MKVEDLDIGSAYLVHDVECVYVGTDIINDRLMHVFEEVQDEFDWFLASDDIPVVVQTEPEPDECYCGHCYYCCGVSRSDFLDTCN